MSNISNMLSLLTPGAVFLNEKGRTVKFLMLTNTDLPAKVQVKHPPQVVYADDEGNFYNRDVDNFLEYYKFYNVDPELESRLDNLLVFNADDSDEITEEVVDEDDGLLVATDTYTSVVGKLLTEGTVTGRTSSATPAPSNVPQATKILATALAVETEDDLLLPPEQVTATKKQSTLKVEFSTLSSTERTAPLSVEPSQLTDSLVAYSQYPDISQ